MQARDESAQAPHRHLAKPRFQDAARQPLQHQHGSRWRAIDRLDTEEPAARVGHRTRNVQPGLGQRGEPAHFGFNRRDAIGQRHDAQRQIAMQARARPIAADPVDLAAQMRHPAPTRAAQAPGGEQPGDALMIDAPCRPMAAAARNAHCTRRTLGERLLVSNSR
jgi:hypothetical protein